MMYSVFNHSKSVEYIFEVKFIRFDDTEVRRGEEQNIKTCNGEGGAATCF